jgi:hypothetical protein
MKNTIRFIDVDPEDPNSGTLVDMDYTIEEDSHKILDLRIHSIIDGTVGELAEVDPIVKLAFAGYFLKFLESNKQDNV